ncbi:unnamed protein product [Caenorhabditis angaria]|uniref:Methionine aminopeptidase n=1 Tax=Caenorhabditis angaria TaxID=860376 RepID=A0A9P1IRJ9_9PELO|nr:unnamed protein product [Caenorhabditis angaria]
MEEMEGKLCSGAGCEKPAKLRCPTCIKKLLPDAFFCDQTCFKSNWSTHKNVHTDLNGPYNPWPFFSYTGTLRPAKLSERRTVPEHIPRPDYVLHPEGVSLEERQSKNERIIKVLTDDEIEGLKVACKLGRECLDEAARVCDVGVTTDEIDRAVHEAAIERDCYPSPLGYYKFPKSCCTSVNEVICHGIPDVRPLENGDLCNVDVTVFHRGFHGDLNETFLVGDKVDAESRKLVQTTYECLQQAIAICRPGVKFREIGNVIQKHANANGFSVVKSFCGHGIHRLFHTAPNIPHYAKNSALGVMKAGNAFTIEPMINIGTHHDERWPDDWTAVTRDGKRSAQFEQTLIITETGCEILTDRSSKRAWFYDQIEQKY